ASSLTHEEIVSIYEATLAMFHELRESPRPCLVKDSEDTVDATPIPLLVNSGLTVQDLPTLSQALVVFLAQRKKVVEKKDSELERLQRQLDQQIKGIEATESEAAVLQAQGDLLYTSYAEVSLTLGRMKALAQKNNWEHLKEEGVKVPLVTSVDPRKKSFHMKVGEEDVALDYDVGIDENANRLYTQAKELREKTSGARTAMEETRRAIGKRVVKGEKEALLNKDKVAPTKRFWYESYKWFLTSGGRLVVGGRDVKSNDQVVKKHLGEKERYAHADMHGAPSIVLKNGAGASEEEMREVCQFALCHSKAWNAGAAEGTAYWVLPDQVSKRPEAGEFAPRGAFIIRGKRNYIYHLPLEMLVAELEVEGARKVMCAPRESVADRSVKYVIITPGKTPRGKMSAALARAFQVPEEEISRILPPGDMAIKEAHGVSIE
ncbi:MAG: NFACT family protein, partial [Methanomassiliicoccales archaeon]|nr:NFACT family protein [Methanomassiliicoccales archaeon]